MVNLRNFLEIMKKNSDIVNVYVGPEKPIITGHIHDILEDCVVMSVEKGKYRAVIPLGRILMVSIAGT